MISAISEIFRYRELVRCLVEKELKLRYKRSLLGMAWTMVNPFLMMVILTLVFSNIMRVHLPHFPVFILSALLPWNFLSQAVSGGAQSILFNESLIKKVYVPRAVFPISMVLSHLVNLLFALIPLFAIMLILGMPLRPSLIAVVPATVALSFFVLGLALALSALTVFYRDITHLIEVGLTAWFYLTPIVYPTELVPERFAWLFRLNPMLHLLAPFRDALYLGTFPPLRDLALLLSLSLVVFFVGLAVFRRREREFVIHLS